MWHGYGDHGWGWGMGIGMLLFWLLILVGAVWLVRLLVGRGDNSSWRREKTPLDILKERYARGEIDKDEYERKKRDLQD